MFHSLTWPIELGWVGRQFAGREGSGVRPVCASEEFELHAAVRMRHRFSVSIQLRAIVVPVLTNGLHHDVFSGCVPPGWAAKMLNVTINM